MSSLRVTRSIVNPEGSKKKEPSPEPVKVKKISTVKKPKKEEEIYQVEALLDKKKLHGVWRYKVKWQGYPDEECTWEPAKNLENVKSMIQEFNKNWKEPEGDSDSDSGSESSSESETEGEEKPEKKAKKPAAKKAQTAKPKEKKEKAEKAEKKEKKENKVKTGGERESRKEKKSKNKEERKSSISKSPKKKLKTEKDTASMSGSSVRSEYGSLDQGDKVRKLLVAKSENSTITFTVDWEARKDGTIPKKSYVTNTQLRKHHKDLLLDYYEERLKFVKPASSKPNTVEKQASASQGNIESSETEKSQSQKNMNIETNTNINTNNNAIEEEKEVVKNNDNMEVEKEGEGESQAQAPVQAELEPENKEREPETINEEIVENGKQQEQKPEELTSADMIQNQGQTIFADVGTNNVQEIRDLTLDANMMVYDQAEKVNKEAEAEAARNDALTETESFKDPSKSIEEALEVKGLEA